MRIKLHYHKYGPIGVTYLCVVKEGVIREYTRMTPCRLKNTHQYYNPGKDSKIFNVSASEGRDMLAFT